MTKHLKMTLVLTAFLFASQAHAFFSPLSVSVIPPVQFPPSDFSITGVRASILWGRHRDIYGLDLGVLGNVTEQDFVGIGVAGLVNVTQGTTTILGLQAAGVANINTNKTSVLGLQLALGLNQNTAESSVTGLQLAIANLSDHTKIYGFQVGIYNRSLAVYGFQVGVVNVTDNLHCVQIGLINFNKSGFFKVSPILNVGF